MSTYLTVSSLLSFLSSLLLVTFVSSAGERNPVRRRFFCFLLSVTAWSGAYFLWQISSSESSALFYVRALTVFAAIIPITFYHFCLALSGLDANRSLFWGYFAMLGIIALVPTKVMVAGVSSKFGHRFWPDAGGAMFLYLLYWVGYVLGSGYVLFKGWRRHLGRRASDHLFVFYTCLIGFVGGATNFPLWYDVPIQPYGNALIPVYVFLLGHGLYYQRISGLSTDVYKAAAGLLLNGAIALLYLLCVTLFRTQWGAPLETYEYWMHGSLAFFVSVLVFWGVPRLKFRVERIMAGVFGEERTGALAELQILATKLSDLAEEETLAKVTVNTIMDAMELRGAAVYVMEPFSSHYRCKFSCGTFPLELSEYDLSADNPIVDGLSERPECLVLDQVYGEFDDRFYQALVEIRNNLGLSVVVPIFSNHEIYGFIFLGEFGQPRTWSEQEVSSLFNIGAQIGLNLRVRDFERRSNEVDKLVALGTMAAGLAHEIRNPLVSVQTLASFMRSGKPLEKISEDFKEILLRDVRRIQGIVDGVSMYSKNQQGKKVPVRLEDVVEASMEIHRQEADALGVDLSICLEQCHGVTVRGNFDQLVQVFNNLIENALQALRGGAQPEVKITMAKRRTGRKGGAEWVEVLVADNGEGIPSAILPHVFDPFITSKDTGSREEKKGMGLGLAISKRIIENHNGAITVSNNESGGATFVVSLRCFNLESEHESD